MSSQGQGSLGFDPKSKASGAPFSLNAANNGTSVDPVSKKIVLGQAVNEVGDPGQVITTREIKLSAGTILIFKDDTGAVCGFIDNDAQIVSWGYDLFNTEPDRMLVAGPAAGGGEGVELKGAQRINLSSPQVIFIVAPPVNTVNCDVLVMNTNGGLTQGRIETITGASGSFTTTDGKTVTVTRGVITAIV